MYLRPIEKCCLPKINACIPQGEKGKEFVQMIRTVDRLFNRWIQWIQSTTMWGEKKRHQSKSLVRAIHETEAYCKAIEQFVTLIVLFDRSYTGFATFNNNGGKNYFHFVKIVSSCVKQKSLHIQQSQQNTYRILSPHNNVHMDWSVVISNCLFANNCQFPSTEIYLWKTSIHAHFKANKVIGKNVLNTKLMK